MGGGQYLSGRREARDMQRIPVHRIETAPQSRVKDDSSAPQAENLAERRRKHRGDWGKNWEMPDGVRRVLGGNGDMRTHPPRAGRPDATQHHGYGAGL